MKSSKYSNVCSTVLNTMIWEQKTSRLRGKFNRRAICRGKSSLKYSRVGKRSQFIQNQSTATYSCIKETVLQRPLQEARSYAFGIEGSKCRVGAFEA